MGVILNICYSKVSSNSRRSQINRILLFYAGWLVTCPLEVKGETPEDCGGPISCLAPGEPAHLTSMGAGSSDLQLCSHHPCDLVGSNAFHLFLLLTDILLMC